MPPCFKARFGIKCLIKVPWHVIKHLAKAAFPTVFSAKQPLCKRGEAEGGGCRQYSWSHGEGGLASNSAELIVWEHTPILYSAGITSCLPWPLKHLSVVCIDNQQWQGITGNIGYFCLCVKRCLRPWPQWKDCTALWNEAAHTARAGYMAGPPYSPSHSGESMPCGGQTMKTYRVCHEVKPPAPSAM